MCEILKGTRHLRNYFFLRFPVYNAHVDRCCRVCVASSYASMCISSTVLVVELHSVTVSFVNVFFLVDS